VKVPATGYVRLTVNGQAYGLYLNLETPDSHFLKRRFGDDSGILYEAAYGVDLRAGDVEKFELDDGDDPGRAALAELISALDAPGDDVFYGAHPMVDTASFLGMMAAAALLGDWDNYYSSNNYRIYWNPSASRWFFIPTGIDQTFGDKAGGVFAARGLLFQKCLASERCLRDYADEVREVADRFDALDLSAKMDSLLSVIGADSEADPKRSYKIPMTTAREEMRAFIANRPTEVRAALSCIDDGREATLGACAGAVAVNVAVNQCVEVPSEKAARIGVPVTVGRCRGAPSQRWRFVANGDAFALTGVPAGHCLDVKDASDLDGTPLQQQTCTGLDSQLFLLRPVAQGIQLVAKHSGKCVAIAPGNPKDAALIQVPCAEDLAQTWQVQRSIYK
jgi:hypothetical protein